MKNFLFVLLYLFINSTLHAQSWKWNVGINNSSYQFVNSSGLQADFMKPQGGISISFARNNVLLDTIQMISNFSKSAFFFNNHPAIGKIASQLHYEYGVDLKEFNAVGDFQTVSVAYNTHFAGAFVGFGPEFNLSRGYYLNFFVRLGLSKMLSGTQLLNNKYLDLSENEMFKPVQFFTGYSVEINKRLADRFSMFIQYQKSSTNHQNPTGQSYLNFNSSNYSIGIRLSKF